MKSTYALRHSNGRYKSARLQNFIILSFLGSYFAYVTSVILIDIIKHYV